MIRALRRSGVAVVALAALAAPFHGTAEASAARRGPSWSTGPQLPATDPILAHLTNDQVLVVDDAAPVCVNDAFGCRVPLQDPPAPQIVDLRTNAVSQAAALPARTRLDHHFRPTVVDGDPYYVATEQDTQGNFREKVVLRYVTAENRWTTLSLPPQVGVLPEFVLHAVSGRLALVRTGQFRGTTTGGAVLGPGDEWIPLPASPLAQEKQEHLAFTGVSGNRLVLEDIYTDTMVTLPIGKDGTPGPAWERLRAPKPKYTNLVGLVGDRLVFKTDIYDLRTGRTTPIPPKVHLYESNAPVSYGIDNPTLPYGIVVGNRITFYGNLLDPVTGDATRLPDAPTRRNEADCHYSASPTNVVRLCNAQRRSTGVMNGSVDSAGDPATLEILHING